MCAGLCGLVRPMEAPGVQAGARRGRGRAGRAPRCTDQHRAAHAHPGTLAGGVCGHHRACTAGASAARSERLSVDWRVDVPFAAARRRRYLPPQHPPDAPARPGTAGHTHGPARLGGAVGRQRCAAVVGVAAAAAAAALLRRCGAGRGAGAPARAVCAAVADARRAPDLDDRVLLQLMAAGVARHRMVTLAGRGTPVPAPAHRAVGREPQRARRHAAHAVVAARPAVGAPVTDAAADDAPHPPVPRTDMLYVVRAALDGYLQPA